MWGERVGGTVGSIVGIALGRSLDSGLVLCWGSWGRRDSEFGAGEIMLGGALSVED